MRGVQNANVGEVLIRAATMCQRQRIDDERHGAGAAVWDGSLVGKKGGIEQRAKLCGLREGGSGRIAAFAYAALPLVAAQGVAYALYRLEMNIRMAAVLGFVGAGGLGQLLYFHLSIFQQAQAATLLMAMFVLVFTVDSLSAFVRGRLLPAHA